MLKWLIGRRLAAFEREHDYDASYLREVLATDVSALLVFFRATGLGKYRKDIPTELYFAVQLTTVLHADCGPCTQLAVGLALQAGVAAGTIAAVLAGDETRMSPEVTLAVRFARAVIAHAAEADECREAIARRWGQRAVLALAFSILNAQLYPTLKYALGHGKACTRVLVGGETITPRRIAAGGA
jgi:hypothetical protein